jgi:hypothetical protein
LSLLPKKRLEDLGLGSQRIAAARRGTDVRIADADVADDGLASSAASGSNVLAGPAPTAQSPGA